jgi:hypothetical protein
VAGLVAVAAVGAVVAASFGATLDERLGSSPDPAVADAVAQAKTRPLARVDPPPGLSAATRARLADASEDASVKAFHLGMGISAALVGLGGIFGFAIRNPRRVVKCSDCAGGQLVGAPEDAARTSDHEVAVPA